MRSCPPNMLTNWGDLVDHWLLKKELRSRYRTGPESINGCRGESVSVCVWVCMRERTPDFKICMKNTTSFFLNTEKESKWLPERQGRKRSSNSARAKGADQREAVCRSGLQGSSSPDSQVRELKEK